jgi:predicted RNA polymerase sigma factor
VSASFAVGKLRANPQLLQGLIEEPSRLIQKAKSGALRVAGAHMRARTDEETDWAGVVLLYDALLQINPSPIVAIKRAVAVA